MRISRMVAVVWLALMVVCFGEIDWFGDANWRLASLKDLRLAAQGKKADAMVEMGRRYAEADGGIKEIDLEEAFDWYLEAAEEGSRDAQYYVATAYRVGSGVKADADEAAEWKEKANEPIKPPRPSLSSLERLQDRFGVTAD